MICFLLLGVFQLLSKRMELFLYWYGKLSLTLYPCAEMKYQVHQMAGMKLSTPTIYVSMELFVLIFFFVELMIGNPRPKDNPPPECPRILGWTANNASTHHFKIPLPLALRVSESLLVPLRYRIRCTNLAQSYLLGARTLVVRNVMDVQVSGLSLLVAYKVFDTIFWKSLNFS